MTDNSGIEDNSHELLRSCQRTRHVGEWLLAQLEARIEGNVPPDEGDAWLWGARDTMVTHYTRLSSHLTKILQLEDKLMERCAEQAQKMQDAENAQHMTTREVNDEDRKIIQRYREKLEAMQNDEEKRG